MTGGPGQADCVAAVAGNPRDCGVAPDLLTGSFACTGVPGVDAQYSGADLSKDATWSIDQIAVDYFDNTLKVPHSFPGNAGPTYDPRLVSVMSPAGCVGTTAEGGKPDDNCSRGLRLTSLQIGPAAQGTVYDETRSLATPADVANTFYARRDVRGTSANWTTAGVVPGNVYSQGAAAATTLRLRMVGDLPTATAAVSDDGRALALGVDATPCSSGCGSTSCAGRYCAAAAASSACTAGVASFVPDESVKCPDPGPPDAAGAAVKKAPPQGQSCNPAAKPMAAACMVSGQCPAFPERTAASPAPVPTLAPATGTLPSRALYARTGGQVVTRDVWGPGEYEFELIVPSSATPGVTGPPNYCFALGLESENEIQTIFDPTFGAESVTPGQDNPSWVPSEQAPWTSKMANTCDQLTPAVLADIDSETQYLQASAAAPFLWAASTTAETPPRICVGVGLTAKEQLAASNTFQLLGCRADSGCVGDDDCSGLNPLPPLGSSEANKVFTCQAVELKGGQGKACLPVTTDPTSDLGRMEAQLKEFWKTQTPTQVGQNGPNCLAMQAAWQTGIDGGRWCGHNQSYLSKKSNPPCSIATTVLSQPGTLLAPGLQARYNRPPYDPVLFTPPVGVAGECVLQDTPETPYMTVSNSYGSSDTVGGGVGGTGAKVLVRHALSIELPSSTATPYKTSGSWGFDTLDVTTGLADNGVEQGTNTWHTRAMVANASVANPKATPAGAYASTAGLSVRYRVRWWADRDPTKSFVEVSFAGRDKAGQPLPYAVLYSTSRFVPTRGGRWVVGPFPGSWASGTDASGNPQALPFDWVYVDLVRAGFRPYSAKFLPAGRRAADLKLRAISGSRDQQFSTTVATLPETVVQVGATDTAGKQLTCTANTGDVTCEIRCGLEQIGTGALPALAACKAAPAAAAAGAAAAGVTQCYSNADCPLLSQPHCNLDIPSRGYCTGCVNNADCPTDSAARCDQVTKACVPCRGGPATPCTDGHGARTYCEAGQCVNPTTSNVSRVVSPPTHKVPIHLLYGLLALCAAVVATCIVLAVWISVRDKRDRFKQLKRNIH
jgi:hypothetical protein